MSDGLYAYVDTTAPARHKRSRSRSRSRSRTRPRDGADRGPLTLEAIEEKEDVLVSASSIHSGSPSSDDDDERWAKFKKTASAIEDIELQMNKHGLPLFPQPVSDDAEDPLTWRWSVKIRILALISALSFHAQFTAFCISPAIWNLSQFFQLHVYATSFVIGVYLIVLGIAPFIWNPLSQSFGRRPLFILGLLGSAGMAMASSFSPSYTIMLVFRGLNGLFAGVPIGLGSVVVCDLFFQHERGLYMGIYVFVQITGANLAPIIGGYLNRSLSWHWCFYVSAMLAVALLILTCVSVPETLYSRAIERTKKPQMSLYSIEMLKKKRRESRSLRIAAFFRPFRMLKYPSVAIMMVYYSVATAYGSTIFFFTSSFIFHHYYHYHAWQIGLILGIPSLLGSMIGEAGAGGFSDWVSERRALKRSDKTRIPEDRLVAMLPGVILAPAGLFIEGFCVQHLTHWIGPSLGIGLASAGVQIISTVSYSYTADCYPRQAAETATLLNFGRQVFSFFVGFYAVRIAFLIGIQWAWTMFAGIEVVCFIAVIFLIWKGRKWREAKAEPDWNRDL